jgi:hypothetical protein
VLSETQRVPCAEQISTQSPPCSAAQAREAAGSKAMANITSAKTRVSQGERDGKTIRGGV